LTPAIQCHAMNKTIM